MAQEAYDAVDFKAIEDFEKPLKDIPGVGIYGNATVNWGDFMAVGDDFDY